MAAKKKDDWKKRFVEEFDLVNERTNALEKELLRQRFGESDISFSYLESRILESQFDAMVKYRNCLKKRAAIQDIDLDY